MSRNTDYIRKVIFVFICLAFVSLLLILGNAILSWRQMQASAIATHRAQSELEAILTAKYAAEAQDAIRNYHIRVGSLEAIQNPMVLSEFVTGPLLDVLIGGNQKVNYPAEPFWLIPRSVDIKQVRILEHSPERFKAVACTSEVLDRITPTGTFLNSSSTFPQCTVYVFLQENHTWKIAAILNIDDLKANENYRNEPEWLRTLIGDLPEREYPLSVPSPIP